MGYTCFDVSESDGVAHVRLNRPDQLNTMIAEFWSELPQIIDEISSLGRARVIVISSTGKHFCAGMDLSVFTGDNSLTAGDAEVGRLRALLRDNVLHLQRSFTALEEARIPVLVAIQGGCVGGGVDLVTAADCRYATVDAWFSIHEINIGMTADVGTLQRLPKLIPEGVAREYAYTGRRLGASALSALWSSGSSTRFIPTMMRCSPMCWPSGPRSQASRPSRFTAPKRCSTTRETTPWPTGSGTSPRGRAGCSSPPT